MSTDFVDPRHDFVFKKIFGDKVLLTDFLSQVLQDKKNNSIEYLSTNLEPEFINK